MSGAAKHGPIDERYLDKLSLVDANFDVGGPIVRESIGRITDSNTSVLGTGFVISRGLIMTCEHVGRCISNGAAIQFRYLEPQVEDGPGCEAHLKKKPYSYEIRPDILYYQNTELDFAVIAVCKPSGNAESLKSVTWVSTLEECLPTLRISIYSHPEGKPMRVAYLKKVVVRSAVPENMVLGTQRRPVTKKTILHKADTESGSSGAPIFDAKWRLIGIHQGVAGVDQSPTDDVLLNYGTLIKYIIDDMYSRPEQPCTEFEEKLRTRVKDLGVPFSECCFKLEDVPEDQAPPSAPPPAFKRSPSVESGYDARNAVADHNRNRLSEKELRNLSRMITPCWESLGIHLDIEYSSLEIIRQNNIQFPSPDQKALQMLMLWHKSGGIRPQLVSALKEERLVRVAEMFM